VVEFRRGFGKAIFDFAAFLIALELASALVPATAQAIHFTKDLPANEAIWVAATFLFFVGILLFLGAVAYHHTKFSLEIFDPILGCALGIGVAVIVGHVLVKTLAVSASMSGNLPEVLRQSTLGMEFYHFYTYHKVMAFMYTLGG
jgi:uncharacterized membrane protein required for colicin V production